MIYDIVIADDNRVIREGIRRLIDEESDGLAVSGEAADGLEVLALMEKHQPDLVILDISMPRMSGIEAARQIRSLYPQIKILIFTMYEDPEYQDEALAAGVDGYLLKTDSSAEFLSAIERIRRGEVYLSRLS